MHARDYKCTKNFNWDIQREMITCDVQACMGGHFLKTDVGEVLL
jgi:hypothetical protein